MRKFPCCCFFLLISAVLPAQEKNQIDSFRFGVDIRITIDKPAQFSKKGETIIVFYALPNGNSTEQTMGKKMAAGDDWHFDIQHIRAQTAFIRHEVPKKNIVVIYLENDYKSWPAWKLKHPAFKVEIPELVDSLASLIPVVDPQIYFNGHSGGGSFIFGYLAGITKIPIRVRRISFLDSNYGYDSSYYPKIRDWLKEVNDATLNVFAYNDSIALYNGKPFVSATGGTWWRSHLMLKHLNDDFRFVKKSTDSIVLYLSTKKEIQFFFKPNTNRDIYHTQQVELNGFIHSVLCGTKSDSKNYRYYGARAYNKFIQ